MWRKKNNPYEIPPKPRKLEDQVSTMWDAIYNHIPGILREHNKRLKWQDIKLNFILVFVGLILAALTIWTIYPTVVALLK